MEVFEKDKVEERIKLWEVLLNKNKGNFNKRSN